MEPTCKHFTLLTTAFIIKSLQNWIKLFADELPEDNHEASPAAVLETRQHRLTRMLSTSDDPYEK